MSKFSVANAWCTKAYIVNIYFIRHTIFFLPLNISPSSDIQWNVVAKSCKILSLCDHTLRDLLSIIAKYYGDTVIRNLITFSKKMWFWIPWKFNWYIQKEFECSYSISIITVICNLCHRLTKFSIVKNDNETTLQICMQYHKISLKYNDLRTLTILVICYRFINLTK